MIKKKILILLLDLNISLMGLRLMNELKYIYKKTLFWLNYNLIVILI
jgi:hypothetical protein